MVTLRDVALAAGVSQAAVSRTLRGDGAERFTSETRRRIEEAARKLGYRPSYAARVLATGRTQVVGLWTYHPYQALGVQVMEHMDRQAHEHGYGLVVSDIATRGATAFDVSATPIACDGLLALDCGPYAEAIARVRPAEDTPVVSLGTNLLPGTSAVRVDLGSAFRGAAQHLAEQGCRRIAYFSAVPGASGSSAQTTFVRPREAYSTFLGEAGLPTEFVEVQQPSRAAARETIAGYIRGHGCPEAILCRNDDLAIGAYRAACDLGIEVGRDLLLVGCDGQEDTEYFPCPLSTIVFPVEQMCRLAWEYLEARMTGTDRNLCEVTFAARLEIRQSSARNGGGPDVPASLNPALAATAKKPKADQATKSATKARTKPIRVDRKS